VGGVSDLYHRRTQFPVGEGFFHGASVWTRGSEERDLSYVYDCGAQLSYRAERDAQITDYVNSYHCRQDSPYLDLLFLSHAHVDHINGVPRLMDHVSVGTVVMPLIEPSQRLMALAHATHHGEIEMGVQEFYEEFTASPAAAVLSRGAERVIKVAPGRPASPGSEDPPRDSEVVELTLARGDTAPQSWRLVGTGGAETETPDDVTVLRIPDTVRFEATAAPRTFPWVLIPHVVPPVRRRAAAFRTELERRLGKTPEELDEWFADSDRMRDLVTTHRAELVASYLHASQHKDLNITSMSLYSGPDRPRPGHAAPKRVTAALVWQRGKRVNARYLSLGGDDLRVGWLGTGDAALKQKVRRTPFLTHFKPYADYIHTMTLPHHGSAHSYHPDLAHHLAPEICVAPAAPYSTWQHPGPTVVASASQHALVLPVSHLPDSRLDEHVDIAVH
jgi:hypothetical protein